LIEKTKMSRAFSTYDGEVYTGKETTWRQGVDGRIVLKWFFEKLDGGHGLD
jgi:hypothetical protein